jgi:hypothetical protein
LDIQNEASKWKARELIYDIQRRKTNRKRKREVKSQEKKLEKKKHSHIKFNPCFKPKGYCVI